MPDKPACGGSCNGCSDCPDLHPAEMQSVEFTPPRYDDVYFDGLAAIDSDGSQMSGFESTIQGIPYRACPDLSAIADDRTVTCTWAEMESLLGSARQAGRRELLAEQAANRQILAKHWEK